MLSAFFGLFIIDITIGGLGFGDPTNTKLITAMSALLLFFGFFYASTLGPLAWLNAAELPTARLRTLTNAFVLLCKSFQRGRGFQRVEGQWKALSLLRAL